MNKNNDEYLNLWIKSGLNIPNPNNIQYIISTTSEKYYDIEGRELNYTQINDTHHGCQCNLNGDEENHKLITNKLKKICELFKEIEQLNINHQE